MDQKMIRELSKRHQIPQKKLKNSGIAFLSGGVLSVIAQLLNEGLRQNFSDENAVILVILILIGGAAVLTGLGIYDQLAKFAGAGLFVPITGFSNALSSSAMECRKEGLIYGIGSNMFKLAGSVITYGIVSAIIFSFISYGVSLL